MRTNDNARSCGAADAERDAIPCPCCGARQRDSKFSAKCSTCEFCDLCCGNGCTRTVARCPMHNRAL